MNISELLKQVKNQLEVTLPLMEGREKGSLVLNTEMTITDWGYLTDHEKNEEYVAFIVKEDPANFYFGACYTISIFYSCILCSNRFYCCKIHFFP